ncbi:uncharacterized protein LOC143427211 [Xylocopa sonorina]|uniref:uncharacterized protein LOC143427211 n=1 Tax=Xylocopa sonorina TaxID=1818115 RepID=UPI00403B216B
MRWWGVERGGEWSYARVSCVSVIATTVRVASIILRVCATVLTSRMDFIRSNDTIKLMDLNLCINRIKHGLFTPVDITNINVKRSCTVADLLDGNKDGGRNIRVADVCFDTCVNKFHEIVALTYCALYMCMPVRVCAE